MTYTKWSAFRLDYYYAWQNPLSLHPDVRVMHRKALTFRATWSLITLPLLLLHFGGIYLTIHHKNQTALPLWLTINLITVLTA